MGAARSLTEREAMVAAYDSLRGEGVGYCDALQRVATQFGVGTASVGRYVRARVERGSLEPRPPMRPSVPRKLTPEQEAVLVAWALAAPERSLYALQQRLKRERGVEASEITLRRTLHRAGVKKRRVLKEKREREAAAKARVGFGPQHRRQSDVAHRSGLPAALAVGETYRPAAGEPEIRAVPRRGQGPVDLP